METKLYPDSGVELDPFTARNYDKVMNIGSFGMYRGFIKSDFYHKMINIGFQFSVL